MNHDQPRDWVKISHNLTRATINKFFSDFAGYGIVLAVVSFLYQFVDKTHHFDIWFVLVATLVVSSLYSLLFYSNGRSAIESEKTIEMLKDYVH